MKSARTTLALTLALAAGSLATADEVPISMFSNSFSPASVNAEIFDTITWEAPLGHVHTVTSGLGPDDPGAGALFDIELNEANNFTFSFEIREIFPDGIPFFCRDHYPETQQLGFINVSGGAMTERVGVVDNIFQPPEVWIFAGDSVRWEHEPNEDDHTVTSGFGSEDPFDGQLFNVESTDSKPFFTYRFDDAGVCPYYCIPHEDMGMVGTVFVQKRFVRGDATGDAEVDVGDVVATLFKLFVNPLTPTFCDDALDANDDGKVDIGDPIFVLEYLFKSSKRIPVPYPFVGADRTEDDLDCLPESS